MKKAKIGKHEFAQRVANEHGFTKKDVLAVLEAVGETLAEVVKGGTEVGILGGSFYQRVSAPRLGVKPGTSERVQYPGKTKVAFRAGSTLKADLE